MGKKHGGLGAYWKGEDTQLVHFIGRQHRLPLHHFPILLKEHGGYLLAQRAGQRVHEPRRGQDFDLPELGGLAKEYIDDFPGRSDEMRYVLASILPEQKDAEFTWEDFQSRVNNELADVLGTS